MQGTVSSSTQSELFDFIFHKALHQHYTYRHIFSVRRFRKVDGSVGNQVIKVKRIRIKKTFDETMDLFVFRWTTPRAHFKLVLTTDRVTVTSCQTTSNQRLTATPNANRVHSNMVQRTRSVCDAAHGCETCLKGCAAANANMFHMGNLKQKNIPMTAAASPRLLQNNSKTQSSRSQCRLQET